MVAARDSKSRSARSGGSSPLPGTNMYIKNKTERFIAKLGKFHWNFVFWEGVMICFFSIVGVAVITIKDGLQTHPFIMIFLGFFFLGGLFFVCIGKKNLKHYRSLDS